MFLLLVGTFVTSCSPKNTFPEVGVSNPAIILINVVFPQPDGPSNTVTEDLGIVKVILSTAVKSPNFFVTFSNLMSYMGNSLTYAHT